MSYTSSNTGGSEEIRFSGNGIKKASLGRGDMADVKKVTNLMVDLIRRSRRLWRTEITHWQSARQAMYHVDYSRTHSMQEVYLDILMDGHLTGITENRTLRTTNNTFVFAIDGVREDNLTEFIKDKPWFEKVLKDTHESIYFGYSPIWIKKFRKGEILEVDLIERGLIEPREKVLLDDYDSTTGIEIDSVKNILMLPSLGSMYGLLEKAAPYCILKRHSWASWDEFEQIYGVPIRIAKIASQSQQVKDEVSEWMEEMGTAAYGVFPVGTDVEIKENKQTDAFNVFMRKISSLDKELSKLVLHQTMTTEDGSSHSQSEVHEKTLGELVYNDKKLVLSFLNTKLVPTMRALGYSIPENAKIIIDQTTDPAKQIEIDSKIIGGGYVLTKDYLERTYGVEIQSLPGESSNQDPGKD